MIISGYIRFKTEKSNAFVFFNKCKNSKITLKNIRITDEAVFFEIKNKDLEKLEVLASECGILIEKTDKIGLINKIKAHKKRKIFFYALLVLSLIFIVRSCCISEITVSGNNYLTDRQIISLLGECGVRVGTFKFGIKQRDVQKKIMQKNDMLSWAWVEVNGTRATVEVREKVLPPEFFDKDFVCNIVAVRDGVITQAIASGGILYAKEGTYVQKGELLIGGVYDSSEYAPVRFVHASGNVFAKTVYTMEDDFNNEYIKYSLNEDTKNAYGIHLSDMYLEKDVPSKNTVTLNRSEKKLKIFGNFYLPLAFTKTEYCEIIKEKQKMNREQTEKYALEELSVRLSLVIPDEATVVNSQKEVHPNSDGSIHVKLTFECVENIGVESPIEFED